MTATVHEHSVATSPPAVYFTRRGTARHEFMASLLPGIAEQKLASLIADQSACLEQVSPDFIQLRIGKKFLLPRYYDALDLPVELTIRLQNDTRCPSSMTHVVAELRPLAGASREVFQARSYFLVRALRYCLLGQDLVRCDEAHDLTPGGSESE